MAVDALHQWKPVIADSRIMTIRKAASSWFWRKLKIYRRFG
jgi:hypothetical protein